MHVTMQFAILYLLPFCAWPAEGENKTIIETRTTIDVEHIIIRPPEFPIVRNSKEMLATFRTKLDHFDPSNPRTFDMRYMYNVEYARWGNPIFLYVGGEWAISAGSLSSGQMYEMAKENAGALLYLEHRFYGESVPTSDLSTSNLAYHSSAQAIEDIKFFIDWLKSVNYYRNSKVILMGCSYSAALAIYAKVIYPDLITGVYATSAPLAATFDMYQYLEVTTRFIQSINPQCADTIDDAISKMENTYINGGKATLHEQFSVCRSSTQEEPLDQAAFFLRFISHFTSLTSAFRVNSACQRLLASPGADSVQKFRSYFAPASGSCAPGLFVHQTTSVKNTAKSNFLRSWNWQQCSEFGWWVTTSSRNQSCGTSVPPTYHYAYCREVFGSRGASDAELARKASATNEKYNVWPGRGAGLKNVVLNYGSNDPWAPLGYGWLPNSQTTMQYIQGSGHCEDMYGSSERDSASMRNAKNNVRRLIRQWLKE